MLHDTVMARSNVPATGKDDCQLPTNGEHTVDTACADRRASDRVPFPAEMILAWNHSAQTLLRYRVLDAGDGGYRIHSSMPVLEGTTGMIVRLLPGRRGAAPLGQPVMVAWCRPSDDEAGCDLGLRLF